MSGAGEAEGLDGSFRDVIIGPQSRGVVTKGPRQVSADVLALS